MITNIFKRAVLFLSILFSIVSFVPDTQAQKIQGYDALGLAMYCNEFLAAPKLPGLSTLLATFGNPLPCVEKRIALGGMQLIQIDGIDATCWRNKTCPPNTIRPDNLEVIEARGRQVQKLAVKYLDITWHYSPLLEHDIKDAKLLAKIFAAAKKGCPKCLIVNSPMSGAKPAGTKIELHGTKVRAFSVSGDGASIYDGDNRRLDNNGFEHRTAGELSTYAWFNELNLRCTGEESGKTVTPLKRTAKPNADLFYQAWLNMQPEADFLPAPPQCKVIREVNGGEIVKPNAEAYCNGQKDKNGKVIVDPRGNRPMLIIRKKGKIGDRMTVRDGSGKAIACYRYYGLFSDIRFGRWYMGDCSGETPTKLYREAQSEWVFGELGGQECLRINAVRRMGTYR